MSLGQIELELDNQGLVLIEGKNDSNNSFESNGSGKSSTMNAITFALFGQTTYGLKADDVVNRHIGKNMSVILHFEVDGTPFRIERYRKHKTHKNKILLFQEDKDITGKSAKDTESKVQELFGVDYSTYMNSIVQGQGNMEVFTQSTDKGKKEILENITNIAVYKKAQDIAKEKVLEQGRLYAEIDTAITESLYKLKTLDDADAEDIRKYEHTKQLIADAEARVAERSKDIETFRNSVDIEQLEASIEMINVPEPQGQTEPSQQEEDLKENIQSSLTTGQSVLANIQNMEADIRRKKQEQSQLDTRTDCPYCGSPLDASHAEKEYHRLEAEIKSTEGVVNSTKEMYNNQFLPLINNMKQELKTLEDDRIKDYLESQKAYNQAQARKAELENKIQNYYLQLQSYVKRFEDAQASLHELHTIPKPEPRDAERERIRLDLEEYNKQRVEIAHKKENYEATVKAFSNTGIRSVVLDLVTPYLNERANKYLAILTGSDIEILFSTQVENKDGSLADKFDVQIINGSGGESYKSNSEGEKKRIDLAISFAIQDLVLSKSNLKTNIALYDECFESLDEVGCENVITLLKERQKEIGTIFVITHNKHLKTLFENIITVQKSNGISEIVN